MKGTRNKTWISKIVYSSICCGIVLAPVLGFAENRTWAYSDGTIVFSERVPDKIIQPKIRRTTAKAAETQSNKSAPAPVLEPVLENKLAMNQTTMIDPDQQVVKLYVASWCKYCKYALDYLRDQGIKVTKYDVEDDSSAMYEKERLVPGGGVPVAVINGIVVSGFTKAKYEKAFR